MGFCTNDFYTFKLSVLTHDVLVTSALPQRLKVSATDLNLEETLLSKLRAVKQPLVSVRCQL